jgi:hypothetical protein
MNIQMEIRQKLLEGKHPLDLIAEGYSRSAVYFEMKRLGSQLPASAARDVVMEAAQPKEVPKPEAEIAPTEATSEQLTDRVAALEREVVALRSLIRNAVDTALLIMLKYLVDEKAARDYAEGWVQRNIEHLIDTPGKS